MAQQGLTALAAFDPAGLSPAQRVSARLIGAELASTVERARYEDLQYPFEQMSGERLAVVQTLTNAHPWRRPEDVGNCLARLAQVATRLDEALAWSMALDEKGQRMPRSITKAALAQKERCLAAPVRDKVQVSTLRARTTSMAGVSDAERALWLQRAEALVSSQGQIGLLHTSQ